MNARWFALSLALCLPFVAGGCALLQSILGGQKPELVFRDVRLTSWSLDKVDLELIYELHNPYDVALELAEVAYQLEVEGKRLLSGMPKEGLKVRGRGKQLLKFPTTVHFLDVVPVVTKLFSKESLGYRASGSLGVDTPLGVVALPLSHTGRIDVPKLPKIEITDLSAPKVTTSGAEFSVGLKLHNPNDFPLALDALDWSFLVDRSSLASGQMKKTSLVKGGQREVRIPIRVGLGGASQAVQRLLAGQKSAVSLTGKLRSGKLSAPVKTGRTLGLDRRS